MLSPQSHNEKKLVDQLSRSRTYKNMLDKQSERPISSNSSGDSFDLDLSNDQVYSINSPEKEHSKRSSNLANRRNSLLKHKKPLGPIKEENSKKISSDSLDIRNKI